MRRKSVGSQNHSKITRRAHAVFLVQATFAIVLAVRGALVEDGRGACIRDVAPRDACPAVVGDIDPGLQTVQF